MRGASIFCAIILAVAALPEYPNAAQWTQFKLEHDKRYDTEEENLRLGIFSENLQKIEEHNALYAAGLKTYKLGITKFADLTDDEFHAYLAHSGYKPVKKSDSADVFSVPQGADIPESLDYREKKAVTPIKDQKLCGGCWAFSTVGSLESINFLKTGKLLSLSEQNLIDCSRNGNYGCDGGLMRKAYDYIRDNGIETEEKYPFREMTDRCHYNQSDSVVQISGYTMVKAGNETDLQAAVALQGPVAVAVDGHDWKLYSGGIFKSDRTPFLSHGVVAIGYGAEKGVDYWLVKNSWGMKWGEEGYIRIARNANNQIGITNDACFPNVI